MGTHARVAIVGKTDELEDANVESIYVHYDGYPRALGAALRQSYNSVEAAKQLISLGDCTTVGADIAEHVRSSSPYVMQGERLNKNFDASLNQFLFNEDAYEEWVYIFRKGQWHTFKRVQMFDDGAESQMRYFMLVPYEEPS